MKRALIRTLLAAAGLLAALPSRADPAAGREAEALLALTESGGGGAEMMGLMRARMIEIIKAAGAKSEADAAAIVDQLLMPDFEKALPDLEHQVAAIWAEKLSADDLRAVAAFYRTEAGQHLLKAMPEISAKTMAAGLAWGQQVARAAVEHHAAELEARGIRL
jgi:hypothetical protein